MKKCPWCGEEIQDHEAAGCPFCGRDLPSAAALAVSLPGVADAGERHLLEAEERFRILVERGSAVVYIDEAMPPSNTMYISPQVLDLFGWTQEEYLREQDLWEKALHPDDRERVSIAEALRDDSGETTSIEYRLINARGETLWIQERSNQVSDADGSPLYWMGVMLDITKQKRDEELALETYAQLASLTQDMQLLRRMDDMKSTFMTVVSHELRSPLTLILGGAVTLQRSGSELSEEESDEILTFIVQGARRMGKLIDDLLNIERLESNQMGSQPSRQDVGQLARRVIEECTALNGHPLELNIESVWMSVEPVWVERILDNLLTNADRHTPKGTAVGVSLTRHGDGISLIVEDEGPGVPDGFKDSVFETFHQGAATEASQGVGIGLALVAKLSDLHGGRAWVEDGEGGGASFHVLLASLPTVP